MEPQPNEPTPRLRAYNPDADAAPGLTVASIVEAFLADQQTELKRTTWKDAERIALRLAERFGPRDPNSLRPSEVKAWVLSVPEWTKDSTRWGIVNRLKRIFNWARSDRWITVNPLEGLHLENGDPRRPTSEWEFQCMLRGSDAYFRRVLIMLRSEGCRPQDVRELEFEWIAWDLGVAIIPKERHKSGRITKKPKILVLTSVGMKLLLWLQRHTDGTGRVFRNSRGVRWTRVAFAQRLLYLRPRVGIPSEATLHGIRHLCGKTCIARGGNLKLLSKGMGHAGTAVTEKFYVQLGLSPEDIDAVRQTMTLGARRPRRIEPPK